MERNGERKKQERGGEGGLRPPEAYDPERIVVLLVLKRSLD